MSRCPAPAEVRGGVEGYIALDNAIDDLIAELKQDAKTKFGELAKNESRPAGLQARFFLSGVANWF